MTAQLIKFCTIMIGPGIIGNKNVKIVKLKSDFIINLNCAAIIHIYYNELTVPK